MKKLTAWALLLAMCVAMFAGCSNTEPTAAPTEPVNPLDQAVAYVKTIYKNQEGLLTAKDYEVIAKVPMSDKSFDITWSIEVAEGIVAEDVAVVVPNENGMVTIDVNENATAEVAYVLVATLTDGTETKSLSWNHTVPAAMNVDGMTYGEILEMLYAFEDQQASEDPYRLYGTITSIDTAWSEDYKNITVTIVVPGYEDKPVQCYRLKGEGAKDLKVGDIITVEGVLKRYKSTYEFDAGCQLIGFGEIVDQKALLKAAFALAEGASMDYPAVLTGKIVKIPSAWSDEYGNITVDMEIDGQIVQCYRLKGEGAKDLAEGDVITVTGIIKNYKGTIEYDAGCVMTNRVSGGGVAQGPSSDPNKIIPDALKLAPGEKMAYRATLTGEVVSVDTPYDPGYGNVTVTMKVQGYKFQCYRMVGDGIDQIRETDTITVSGVIENYNGKLEFGAKSTMESRIAG